MGRASARSIQDRSGPETELHRIVDEWWSGTHPSPVARLVIVAAIELFAERGFRGTTTRDIARRVGMSTGAMYGYFGSKEELLFEISATGHRHASDALRSAAADDAAPADQLAAMARVFAGYHARFHTIAKIVHDDLYGMSEEHLAEVLGVRRGTEALIENCLARGVADGAFEVANVPGVARAVLSLCIDVARWYQPGQGPTPEEVGHLYSDLALRMAGACRAC
ncbi:TetR/AcrR family transcriptional regulator [Streptomyces sp. NPDC051985]|uniref:TetR/AcrR family transcriptional regulator n=1 Tax=Streptomyces sp. NPDC051985 TaxID=3155807 RepID=UPI00341CE7F5